MTDDPIHVAHTLERRPRPWPQPSTVAVPGHGIAVTAHTDLARAMAAEAIANAQKAAAA